jgi:hypothetical protein
VHAPILEHAKVALRSGADGLVHGIISEPVDDEFLALMRRNRATYTATLSLYEALAARHKTVARLRTLDRAHRVPDSTWKDPLEPEELSSYRKLMISGIPSPPAWVSPGTMLCVLQLQEFPWLLGRILRCRVSSRECHRSPSWCSWKRRA